MKTLYVVIWCTLAALVLSQDGSEIPDFDWDEPTHLDEYVHRDDGAFSWYLHDTIEYQDVTVYLVNMTSQKWLNESRVTRSYWWHMMGIAVPHNPMHTDVAFLFIDGGSNTNDDPEDWPDRTSYFNLGAAWAANDTGLIFAWIRQVPNQSLMFYDDPEQRYRSEDAIIAYTWKWAIDRYEQDGIEEPDMDIILRCPMTKAAVKGFDTIYEVANTYEEGFNVERFIVSGGSKRGWTSWSAAATDQRVIAVAPLVMSLLYFEETVMAHYMAMDGAYSYALKDYYEHNLTQYLTKPIAQPIFELEDMFRYRSRLEKPPKLMVSATGDQFFLNQDSHTWWHLIGGTKHIMMAPNCEHDLFPHWLRVYDTVVSWTMIVVNEGESALPVVNSTREETDGGGVLTFSADVEPVNVRGMVALTPENITRRDFRLTAGWPENYEQDVPWIPGDVEAIGRYDSDYFNREMYFTSEVHIIPGTFPTGPCEGDECTGTLV